MNDRNDKNDGSDQEDPVVENRADPEPASAVTPLRQLLHWATGDREAEAKALADETLAQQNPQEKGMPVDGDQNDAVLVAAKEAVSLAHGDSRVPNEFVEPSAVDGRPKPTNLLSEWEDANSFAPSAGAEDPTSPKVDGDVARPQDVEKIVEAKTRPIISGMTLHKPE